MGQRHGMTPVARAAAIVAAMAAMSPAWAQPAPQVVDVIGTAPLPGAGQPKDRLPSNAQSASAADLDRSQATDLSSFMNRRLGSVHLNEVQNNPFQPDVNYRGFTASPLLGTAQGLSVYVDGVRMNQPFGDVVSWDLIPKAAIASITLNPGANPLFGLNTLGGALVVQTKEGRKFAGSSASLQAGSHGRVSGEFESGGSRADGLHWYVTGQSFRDGGWRSDSPSKVRQLLGKIGMRVGETELAVTVAGADTDLNGNGLQEQRLLSADYASVYTKPDNTRNRSLWLNLSASRSLDEHWSMAANAYYRRLRTTTFNGDLNDDSLDQVVYQPNAAERAALTAAGYSGFRTAGESALNTPFPKWRCIANGLLQDEPAEKCNGLINRTSTRQSQGGFTLQFTHDGPILGLPGQGLLGVAYDASHTRFVQGSELGYLNPDRSIAGIGAFGDGVSGGNVDGEPYDTRVDLAGRTSTWSAFGSATLAVAPGTHLTLAGRYNRTNIRNRDAITPGGGTGSLDGDHVYARFNPALGLTFSPHAALNVYVGISQGSRAPSSVELGCADPAQPCKLPNAFAGDPPLRQVVTTSVEAGVRGGARDGLTWSIGLFRADNKDDLLFVADDAAGFGYFRNFGKTRRQGLELGLSTTLAKGMTVGANLTRLDATYRSPELVNGASNSSNESAEAGFPGVDGTIAIHPGDRIPLVPRTMFKAYADLDFGRQWSVGADVVAVGSAPARGNENGRHQADGTYYLGAGRSAGYAVVNLQCAFQPTPGLKLFAQIQNLFDRQYATAAQLGPTGFDANGNFVARPFATDANGDRPLRHSTFFAPGAPRSIVVGVRYALR